METHFVAPPDLRGRQRPDRLLRIFGFLTTCYEWYTQGADRRRKASPPVDRDLPLVVSEVRPEAQDVHSFRLTSPDGAQLPRWQPGCHLDVVLPSGRQRQYSLCGDPDDRGSYRIAVRRLADGGGGSTELHDAVRADTMLTVRGPHNAFPFVSTQRYLFIAGGIGITPILPMVKAAAASGAQWRMVYAGRSRESMPFLDELAELDANRSWIRPDSEYGVPSGPELLDHAPAGATVYCCGPIPLMAGVRRELPASRAEVLHTERFSSPPIVDSRPFEVALTRSNRVLTVPADRSALDVIRQRVPGVAYSCRQGFCGTCRTRVLSGEVDHRDRVLTDEQRATGMTICVSRANGSRITLDL